MNDNPMSSLDKIHEQVKNVYNKSNPKQPVFGRNIFHVMPDQLYLFDWGASSAGSAIRQTN